MLSIHDINFIINNYPNEGSEFCIQRLGCDIHSVRKIVNKYKLKLTKEIKSKIQQYNTLKSRGKLFGESMVNANNFIKCQTKESSYILGLLWADGSVYKPYRISLECIKEDIDIFYPVFKKTGDWGISYRNRKNRKPSGAILTSNKELNAFLIDNGYGPHTSQSADKILSTIPEKFKPFWFRGIIDGDGCWYINEGSYQFSLAGSYEQDWSYFTNLLEILNIKGTIQKRIQINKFGKKSRSSSVRITSKSHLILLGDYVYSSYLEDKIGLPRKYNKYSKIKYLQ